MVIEVSGMHFRRFFSWDWIQTVYLPMSLLLGILMFVVAHRDATVRIDQFHKNERFYVDSAALSLDLEMNKVISGIKFLSGHEALHKLWDEQGAAAISELQKEFSHFSDISGKFDQIRILDKSGMEMLRVNKGAHGAEIVPANKLQDKSDRYYFKEAIGLLPEQIYISPFDLNIEHGALEYPLKPMLRAATPIIGSEGETKGLLVGNFLGRTAIENLVDISREADSSLMFVTSDGAWLYGGPLGCDWAFMFRDRRQCSFEDWSPDAWAQIYGNKSGQFEGRRGLYTFQTISLSAQGSDSDPETVMQHTPSAPGRSWKLVSFVSASDIWKISKLPYFVSAGVYAFLLILLGVITAAKRRKDRELKIALSEFEALFENSALGFALLKGDRVFHRVNSRLCKILGYAEHELLGETSRKLYVSDEAFAEAWQGTDIMLSTGEVVQREVQFRQKAGDLIWCRISGQAIAPGDLHEGIIWTLENVTERKEFENLSEEVDRIMRHDLKAPLTGVINLPMIIAAEGNLSEMQIESLDLIEEAGTRMLSQINLSLNMFKIESGTYEHIPERVDIVHLLTKQVRYFKRSALAQYRGIVLLFDGEVVADSDFLVVSARADFCHIVFSNIIKNALEATPKGETVTISIEQGPPHLVRVHNVDSVPLKVRDAFFDKYSTAGKAHGLGLGTYSTRMLMEAQHGFVQMETSEESGTTITVGFAVED